MKYRIPLIAKLLFPLIAGILIAYYSGLTCPVELILSICIVLIIGIIPPISKSILLKKTFALIAFFFFFILGVFLTEINDSSTNRYYFGNFLEKEESNVLVKISKPPVEKKNSVQCIVEVKRIDQEFTLGKSLIYFEKSPSALHIKYGDLILLKTNFNPVKTNGNPEEFNYKEYLKINNVHHQAYIEDGGWGIVGNSANNFWTQVYSLRKNFNQTLNNSNIPPANMMVAKALILGEKEYLDKDVLKSYSSAGAMHILAVSGLHVGIIMLVLSFLLTPIKKLPQGKIIFLLLILIGIWFYALITGLSPSVMRAAVMFSFIIIGKEIQRETNIYQSIFVSAFILILFNPYIIFKVGFQLSYMAVLGIVYLQPKIDKLFYFKNYFFRKIWQISAVSLAAQIATFPLSIYYFHQFPNFFLLANILVIPLAFLILLLGILYFITVGIPYLGDFVLYILDNFLSLLNFGVKWVEQLPAAITQGISIHWYEVLLLYFFLILISLAFIFRKPKHLLSSMTILIVLLSLNLYEKNILSNSNELVFYNIKGEFAMDIFHGNRNFFVSSKNLANNENQLLFHVKNHWYYRSGQSSPKKQIILEESPSIFKFGNRTCFILSSDLLNKNSFQFPVTDLIYLRNISYLPKEYLTCIIENKIEIVIGENVAYKLCQFIENQVPKYRIHKLRNEGALIKNF